MNSRADAPDITGVSPRVVVVGSANLDLVVGVERHPLVGETVLGGDVVRHPGGKGANQAVAAARLGAQVAFIGCVGHDEAADVLVESLERSGVELSGLSRVQRPTGIAMITVQSDGDNAIVVAPGANAEVNVEMATSPAVKGAAVLLCQLEIPLDAVAAAARHAAGIVVLDPAPAPSAPLPVELLADVDVLAPNQHELAVLSGIGAAAEDLDEVVAQARALGVAWVVVTLGAAGCAVVSADSVDHLPAPAVEVVDTTAAGDAFRAALAARLITSAGAGLSRTAVVDAASYAAKVGALATTSSGAQPSLPTADEVETAFGDNGDPT